MPIPCTYGGHLTIDFSASKLLEKLYETEIVEKEKNKESVRKQVSELLRQMHQEQKEKMMTRQSRNMHVHGCYQEEVISQSINIGLSFIELWVKIHYVKLTQSETNHEVCQIVSDAEKLGKVPKIVASYIREHLQFLLEETFQC